MPERILIAGIGNIFFGDDAFGIEVVKELAARELPDSVRVIDFGIRGYDLAWALTDGYDAVLLVDALPRGEPPGTVFLFEPDLSAVVSSDVGQADAHAMNPVSILRLASTLGEINARILIVGCEPASLECEEGQIDLTPVVRAAVPEAVTLIESVISELLGSELSGGEQAGKGTVYAGGFSGKGESDEMASCKSEKVLTR
jgi:hydrogenase maturation protease